MATRETQEVEHDLSFADLQDVALLLFYKVGKGESVLPEPPPLASIRYRILDQSDFMSAKAVEGLKDKRLIAEAGVFEPMEISARGIERIERLLRDSNSRVAKTAKSSSVRGFAENKAGDTSFSPEKQILVVALEPIPASDRFVSRDDNSKEFDAAANALDAVISALDGANDLGDVTPAEKEHFRSILATGRRLLNEGRLRVSILTDSVLPALNWLKTKLADITVGTVAGVAAAAIAKLLGFV